MKNSVAVSSRFVLDFAHKAIVGSKASFDKAGKGYGPMYEELVSLMVKHPEFACVVKEPKKPAKPKQTYKGMDVDFMRDYLAAVNDAKTLDTFDAVVKFAKASGKSVYPLAKRVLFDAYDDFNYTTAKKVVSKYRHTQAVAKAKTEAAKNTASTAENKPDLAPASGF